jgi:DNA-binding transcriptional MerR regulator
MTLPAGLASLSSADPLTALRAYRALAPWSLRDLAALAGALLEASNIVPVNAAARAHPVERTIRFYVARGLVSPPEGRGTAATYGYRHLLQVLAIKLRQMEGATLDSLGKELAELAGDMLERRVASALGPALPLPERVLAGPGTHEPRGRVARAMQSALPIPGQAPRPTTCRRIPCGSGVELLLDERHPVLQIPGAEAALARDIAHLLAQAGGASPPAS